MAKLVDRIDPDFARQSYVVEIAKGVGLVTRQFARNIFGRKDTSTVQYPEVKTPYAPRFRGKHRLMLRPDGQVRCVACMLCATACPSNCISIVAAEHGEVEIEKYPSKFEIDLLKCIFCGFCEEACPCDAIRMDTGHHALPTDNRLRQKTGVRDMLADRDALSIAKQGGEFRSVHGEGEHH